MPTNLNIDDELLDEALKVGGQKSKKATVNMALEEFIRRRRQKGITSLFGTIAYEPGYDFKKLRRPR